MKKIKPKKGFTLIELLAVIVILAVIALIATPLIINAISVAKKGSFAASAHGLVSSVENTYATSMSDTGNPVDIFYLYSAGVMTSYPSGKTINYKGTKPQEGGIVLHSDGTITMAIYDGTYCATKVRTDSVITTTATTQANCLTGIYAKQTTAPLTNLVTNGDFSSGTTGWFYDGSSLAVSGNTLSVTGTGAIPYPYTYKNVGTTIVDHTYYIKSKIRVTNPSCLYLRTYFGGLNISWKANPTQNIWYDLSVNTIIAADTFLVFYHDYVDSSTANGKVMEMQYVSVFDLTASYGVGNEPATAQMDNNLNKVWIDSVTNTPKKFTTGGWINF